MLGFIRDENIIIILLFLFVFIVNVSHLTLFCLVYTLYLNMDVSSGFENEALVSKLWLPLVSTVMTKHCMLYVTHFEIDKSQSRLSLCACDIGFQNAQ